MPDESDHLRSALRSLRARLKTAAIREGKDYSLSTLQMQHSFWNRTYKARTILGAQVKLGSQLQLETNRADVMFTVNLGPLVHVGVGARLWPGRRKLLPVYQRNGLTPELIQEGRQNLLGNSGDGAFRCRGRRGNRRSA
jgi:hypothetical protein